MVLNTSKVRSVAAGYIWSELITKLQRTSYAKAWWVDTVILEHYYYRLLQDLEPLICYCKLTIPPENEDVWQGEQPTAGRPTQQSQQLNCCIVTPRSSSTWGSSGVPAHSGHTQAPPPQPGVESWAGQPHCASECSTAPEPPASITKHLLQQSWDPAHSLQQEASAHN